MSQENVGDIEDLVATASDVSWWKRQCLAGVLVFVPHSDNNNVKKILTVGLFTVWSVLTIGEAAAYLTLQPLPYGMVSALVFSIIAKQHDIELDRIQP